MPKHVWETIEIVLEAKGTYANPYTEVDVWVDLEGPGFSKRVYGFWDGGSTFRVRLLATAPGDWRWTSGSHPDDPGLSGQQGAFEALPWSETELAENPNRRGFLRANADGHALTYADGTPFYLLADTWWATATHRFPWREEPTELGPGMSFQDMVQYRRAQGFNGIAMIACYPQWANDGQPPRIILDEASGLAMRSAWRQEGTQSAKDMHNEGGRPFAFPGRVPGYERIFPDVERINPAYFQAMDRKIAYLCDNGMVPFIEALRRDGLGIWKEYYPWPDTYTRYMRYLFSRYQAHNCLLSPLHFDFGGASLPPRSLNAPINSVVDAGVPAFGTLLTCNSSGSSLINFGNDDQAPWLTLHQIGNIRDHNTHWQLHEIYDESEPPKPALNGEPFYDMESHLYDVGWPQGMVAGSEETAAYTRSGMYGSFLSGGLAGYIYGAGGLWGGDIEPEAPYKTWDGLQYLSGEQLRHLEAFVWCEGDRFQELVPNAELVVPNKNSGPRGNRGWSYASRTPEKDLFLVYFELDCPQEALVRGTRYEATYQADWFNPRSGEWVDAGLLTANVWCEVALPPRPDDQDWGLRLKLVEE